MASIPSFCHTANLLMKVRSYTWKIRIDKVACESTCILSGRLTCSYLVFRLTVLGENCRGLCRFAFVY